MLLLVWEAFSREKMMTTRDKELRFKALYQKYYASFCLFARKFVSDSAICEDIVSDVFVNLWSRIDSLDIYDAGATAYIKMSVRNACLNYIRRNGYKEELEREGQFAAALYRDDPDAVYSLEELYDMLYQVLEKLPESHRKVFTASFIEGRTREEIAREMNLSVKSVGRYKQKILELLREELKDFLPVILLFLSGRLS